jgi:hypothetical protein
MNGFSFVSIFSRETLEPENMMFTWIQIIFYIFHIFMIKMKKINKNCEKRYLFFPREEALEKSIVK